MSNQSSNFYYVCVNQMKLSDKKNHSWNGKDLMKWVKDTDIRSISIVFNGNMSESGNFKTLYTLLKRTYPNETTIKNDISTIFAEPSCSNYEKCPSVKKKYAEENNYKSSPRYSIGTSLFPIFFLLPITAIGGNLAVVFNRALDLYRSRSNGSSSAKVRKVHNITILNLALADLVMGVYALIVAISTSVYLNEISIKAKTMVIGSRICESLGLLNFASGQISVTALILITSVRLYSIARPYKLANIKLIIGLIFGSWALWTYLAYIPIQNSDLFKETFVENIRLIYTDSRETVSRAYLKNMTNLVLQTIMQKRNLTEASGDLITEETSWDDLVWLAKKVRLIPKKSTVDYTGYYSQQTSCTFKYLSSYYDKDCIFTMFIIVFNFSSFVYTVVAYAYIICKSSNSATSSKFAQFLVCDKKSLNNGQEPPLPVVEVENLKMQRKIFFIIITDLLCWIPICVISISSIFWTSTMNECAASNFVKQNNRWFNYLVPLLTPINSSINPFLYSTGIWRFLRKTFSSRDRNESSSS
ncbi:unnamed protein product [Clavelina lepadiformis]|uniref:G-protein coupled receptors family 1 profile domain-containing protein n=1 Tax=Clavelina lepadiformis TaxID=159417 RepID=A0ABP0FNI6_CLALP